MKRLATVGRSYLSFKREVSLLIGGEPLKAIKEEKEMKQKRKGIIALLTVAATMAVSVFAGGCDMPKSVEQLICNHEYDESVITVAATCTAEGQSEKTCTLCGKVKITILEKYPHAELQLSKIPPTCTENGYTSGIVCATCGETLRNQEEIPLLGHVYVDNICEHCGEREFFENEGNFGDLGDGEWTKNY